MFPELIRIGGLSIHTYGVLVAAGFITAIALARRRAKSEGIDPDRIGDLGVWLIVAGMLGAKVFHIIFFWNDFIYGWRAEGIASLRQGFVFYGGFIAASLATIFCALRKQIPVFKLADILAPSIAVGHAFGRMGCFFEGCCYGTACHLPWAVSFPATHNTHGQPVHPTELYEVLGNLAIFGVLTLLYRRKRFTGQIWWAYVLGYGALRFAVEFCRGDYETHYLQRFTIGHIIAFAMMIAALVGLVVSSRKRA